MISDIILMIIGLMASFGIGFCGTWIIYELRGMEEWVEQRN